MPSVNICLKHIYNIYTIFFTIFLQYICMAFLTAFLKKMYKVHKNINHLINKLYRIKWFETFTWVQYHYILCKYILRFLCKSSFTILCPSLKYGGIFFSKKRFLKRFSWGRLLENLWRGVHGGTDDQIIVGARCMFQ